MKCLKKSILSWMAAVVLVGFGVAHAQAEIVVDDWDWADSVTGYSAYIQNYGGTKMNDTNTWWLTGMPDADTDDNGYWDDTSEPDYLAGWRTINVDQCVTLFWEDCITDVTGNDLVVLMFGGPSASATVWASNDGSSFTQIGTIGGGTSQYLQEAYFDLNGLFGNQAVHYVQVQRVAIGPQTGMFFDAFGAVTVPEPSAITLLASCAAALFALKWRRLCSQGV